jgi:hypothetical protein
MKVRPSGRQRRYESARHRPRNLQHRSDDTVRGTNALTDATLSAVPGNSNEA